MQRGRGKKGLSRMRRHLGGPEVSCARCGRINIRKCPFVRVRARERGREEEKRKRERVKERKREKERAARLLIIKDAAGDVYSHAPYTCVRAQMYNNCVYIRQRRVRDVTVKVLVRARPTETPKGYVQHACVASAA